DAHVVIAADQKGAGAADVTSGTADFARRDKFLRFEKSVTVRRPSQTIESDTAIAHLTADEDHIDTVELHTNAHVTTVNPAAGALEAVTGRDMNLKYTPDGQTLEHALIAGDAVLRLAGEKATDGRGTEAPPIDVTLAPDRP